MLMSMSKAFKNRKKLLNKILRPCQEVQSILDCTEKWLKRHRMRTLRKIHLDKRNGTEVVHLWYLLYNDELTFAYYNNITHCFVRMWLYHVFLLLSHRLSPASPSFYGRCGTPYRRHHKKSKFVHLIAMVIFPSFHRQCVDFQSMTCLKLYHRQTLTAVMICFAGNSL